MGGLGVYGGGDDLIPVGSRSRSPPTDSGTLRKATSIADSLGRSTPHGEHPSLSCPQHSFSFAPPSGSSPSSTMDWRIEGRVKTVAVGAVMCLHLGVDPPDVLKTQPCARMECWCDPVNLHNDVQQQQLQPGMPAVDRKRADAALELASAVSQPQHQQAQTQSGPHPKAKEAIGRALIGQYEYWQPRVRYKLALDPTAEEVRKLCQSLRKAAKEERCLVHWNGHGTPRPTAGGEAWVFNRAFTQYIPLGVGEAAGQWLGFPATWVIDASAAGNLLDALLAVAGADEASAPSGRLLVLAACGPEEILPMAPELPADLFTACLTTPLEVALRFHLLQSSGPFANTTNEQGNIPTIPLTVPGKLNDRRTPLGQLHWIFTALTDSMAWSLLPRATFKLLYRQDILTASLFRNVLLACRVMRAYHCGPVIWPPLPTAAFATHRLWTAWDLLLDEAQAGIFEGGLLAGFFDAQLTAFEAWIHHQAAAAVGRRPQRGHGCCELLPIVLQVLLSPALRPRALELLGRFLGLGAWAILDALDVGLFPYILRLLHSPTGVTASQTLTASMASCTMSPDALRGPLTHLWLRVLAFDPSTAKDLVKDDAFLYFLPPSPVDPQALACLAAFCEAPRNAALVLGRRPEILVDLLSAVIDDPGLAHAGLLALGALWTGATEAKARLPLLDRLVEGLLRPILLRQDGWSRAALAFAFGRFVSHPVVDLPQGCLDLEQNTLLLLTGVLLADPAPQARLQLAVALSLLVQKHFGKFVMTAYDCWRQHRSQSSGGVVPMAVASEITPPAKRCADLVRGPGMCTVVWRALLALSMDPLEAVARLASSIVDEVHLAFLFPDTTIASASNMSREVLFVQDADAWRLDVEEGTEGKEEPGAGSSLPTSRTPPQQQQQLVLASALPLPSGFVRESLGHLLRPPPTEEDWGDVVEANACRLGQLEEAKRIGPCVSRLRFDRNQLALLSHGARPARLAFHPILEDRLIVADSRSRLSVWDWRANSKARFWVNGNPERSTVISGLLALDQPGPGDCIRLLVASTDGVLRLWCLPEDPGKGTSLGAVHQPLGLDRVATKPTSPHSYCAVDWHASGSDGACWAASSASDRLAIWRPTAQSQSTIGLGHSGCPSAIKCLGSGSAGGAWVAFNDGALRQYDSRSDGPVAALQAAGWLLDVWLPDDRTVVSASVAGDLFWHDARWPSDRPLRWLMPMDPSDAIVQTFWGHPALPVIAYGTNEPALRFLHPTSQKASDPSLASLPAIRYHEGGVFGQRIGQPVATAFHPRRALFAAGSTDGVIGVYQGALYDD